MGSVSSCLPTGSSGGPAGVGVVEGEGEGDGEGEEEGDGDEVGWLLVARVLVEGSVSVGGPGYASELALVPVKGVVKGGVDTPVPAIAVSSTGGKRGDWLR